jgi:Family of unknown function (DUF6521)
VLRWEQRPVEVANLFNPAFCAVLLQSSIRGFQSQRDGGMPYPLLFLVLPIVLHSHTCETLPKSTATKMHVWLQKHPEVRIGFVERSRNLVPYTKEALIFGIQTKTIAVRIDDRFIWVPKSLRRTQRDSELDRLQKRAEFLGKWLAQLEEPSNIFTMWGIRP